VLQNGVFACWLLCYNNHINNAPDSHMEQAYKRYTVCGISDKTECDVCGKTNLKMTIVIESQETGETLHYGSDCAARTLRQDYKGKRYPVSREAAISMGREAKRGGTRAQLSAKA
jgi:hypothetical protein